MRKEKTTEYSSSMVSFVMLIAVIAMVIALASTDAQAASGKKYNLVTHMTTNGKYSSATLVTTMQVKQTGQLKVTYKAKNVTSKVTYKTSNKKVLTISKKGKITAKKAGKATITIKYKGAKTKKWTITVKAKSSAKNDSKNDSDDSKNDKQDATTEHIHNYVKEVTRPETVQEWRDTCFDCRGDITYIPDDERRSLQLAEDDEVSCRHWSWCTSLGYSTWTYRIGYMCDCGSINYIDPVLISRKSPNGSDLSYVCPNHGENCPYGQVPIKYYDPDAPIYLGD